MKTYKGMTRSELIEELANIRAELCRQENMSKYGDGLPRKNENKDDWKKLYKNYPMFSPKYPVFSLVAEYDLYCK